MNKKLIPFALTLFMTLVGITMAAPSPLANSEQAVVVTTKGWDAVPGTMKIYARANLQAAWKQVGKEIPIVVGRSGLGWGKGLNSTANLTGPMKHEGDGKSPAGVFALSSAFGLEEKVKGMRLPYQHLTSAIECVDDVKSQHYNAIVDRDHAAPVDWNSSEKMRGVGEQYRLGVVVEHNPSPSEPGSGSCVFMHIWKEAKTGTSGCTAMERSKMEKFAPWLDPAKHPVLVQMPEAEYQQLQKDWQLPLP